MSSAGHRRVVVATGYRPLMGDEWSAAELFDEDYLHFYLQGLGDAASDAEAAIVWNHFSLQSGSRVLDLACGHGRIANRLAIFGGPGRSRHRLRAPPVGGEPDRYGARNRYGRRPAATHEYPSICLACPPPPARSTER
jgi:SAM-dependent methyltransferase